MNSSYEAIQINVTTSGFYRFQCEGLKMRLYVFMYKNAFNPFNTSDNFLQQNINSNGESYLTFEDIFHTNISYILVVTTPSRREIRNFMINVSGPHNVSFTRLSKCSDYLYCCLVKQIAVFV